jgi:hypothetical protein
MLMRKALSINSDRTKLEDNSTLSLLGERSVRKGRSTANRWTEPAVWSTTGFEGEEWEDNEIPQNWNQNRRELQV